MSTLLYERSSLRYAHSPGRTGLVFTENGALVLTFGGDGDLRVWRSINDDDPGSHCLGEFIYSMAYQQGRLLICTDRNTVQAYKYPSMDNDGQLLRFTAPSTCLRMHKNMIAAGSEDASIKIIKNNNLQQVIELKGHNGPVLALDISCKGLLASVGGDGHLKIWNIENAEEIKCFMGFHKVNSFEQVKCFVTPVFEPVQGKYLAYVKGKELVVLDTNDWQVVFTLSDEKLKGYYTCCSFSFDGRYIAAGSTAGEINVFDFERKQQLPSEGISAECMVQSITDILWHPDHNKELGYCDSDGQWGLLFSSKDPQSVVSKAVPTQERIDFGNLEFDDDESTADTDNYANDSVDENDDADVDELGNDGDGISLEKLKRKVMGTIKENLTTEEKSQDSLNSASSIPAASTGLLLSNVFKRQPPFQPGATPQYLDHRYLIWNHVGIVMAHVVDNCSVIDVEFHDASVHHSIHLSNAHGHNMASLSSTVLVLAAEGAINFMYIPLSGANTTKEYVVMLPDCEGVEALAASSKLIAVCTSKHFLRIFSAMGTQRQVISLPGDIVAMAAYEERVLIVYHAAPAGENQQHLAAMLVQCNGLSLRCLQLLLPLTPQRKLAWLGFTECGSPVFSDSMGLLQLYSLKSNCWLPICDTMKQSSSISNNYFIVAVQESRQMVQALLCRGTSYPMTRPRPMVHELPMQQPLCDLETEKSNLEDVLVRVGIMNIEQRERLLKETALKLFALACRGDHEMRAKELIEIVACPDLLQLAVKYAGKLGRMHLSNRISKLLPVFQEQKMQRETQELLEMSMQGTICAGLASLPQTPNAEPSNSNIKLAPKKMEISSSKRAALQRLSTNAASMKSITDNGIESSENQTESLLDQDSQMPISNITEKLDANRFLNAANPFASKRKLSDVDFFGANKLKLSKK